MLTLDGDTTARLEREAEARLADRLLAFLSSRPELAPAMAGLDAGAFVAGALTLALARGLRVEQDIARFVWLAVILRPPGGAGPRDPCDVAGLPCGAHELRIVEDAVRDRLRSPG